MVAEAVKTFGGLDIMVNNAGYTHKNQPLMGVSEAELPTVEIFAVYTFSRLLSAVPITPGGVGVIDLGYIAGLTAIDSAERAAIVAGVLIFRLLTYGLQIPLGVFTYAIYRRRKGWMRDTPPPGSIAAELERSRVVTAPS